MSIMITISGCSGSGKTALTDALAEKLVGGLVIKFDEIDSLLDWSGSYADWLDRGGDYEEFNLKRMRAYVVRIIQAAPVSYVLFDYPYGRLHSAFRDMIDLAVFVDTPLDLAMARRLLRDLPNDPVVAHPWIKEELHGYLLRARSVYLNFEQQVKPSCDLVIDGTKPLHELVAEVLDSVDRLPRRGK